MSHKFTALNQQNAKTRSLDIYIIISHLTFLLVSVRKRSMLRTNVKYVGCFQDTVYQGPSHLYVQLLHKETPIFQLFVSFAPRQVRTAMNNAVLRQYGFLLMVLCGEKHVGILNVILYYKYLRNKFFHFVGLLS
jgi:hypothetical protein